MPVQFPLSDFFQSSGNAAAVFAEELRDGIATFACSLWSNYPKFITESTVPGASFARGFMNQMCSPIQAPVPAPVFPFTGGQCSGVDYNVDFCVDATNIFVPGSMFNVCQTRFAMIDGAITDLSFTYLGNNVYELFVTFLDGASMSNTLTDPYGSGINVIPGTESWTIVRSDGMPDTCGNPPADYTSPTPTSMDLQTTIVITNLDTVNNTYDLVYNKVTNNYNFPMNFKLNGVNVTLDLGGITIYGPPEVTSPTSGNDVPPPGSDGGDDGVGGNNDTVYTDNEYPTLPPLVNPTVVSQLFEYVVCTDGVISTVSDTIKAAASSIPFASLVVDILVNILTDVCEIGDAEATVGLPEFYGLRAGVDRPAIVYLYKEVMSGTWGASTYSSTVTNPTAAAVAAIDTVVVPDKTMGTYLTQITLNDGAQIRATGDTQASSLTNFNFLLAQVDPTFLPASVPDRTSVATYPTLQIKTVKCRQIEYYPNGKAAGVSPAVRRVIDL